MSENLRNQREIYTDNDIWYNTPLRNGKLGFYVPRDFTFSDDDEYVIIEKRHEFRPYVLSYDLYGNDKIWWIFTILNMDILNDPIRDMREGIVLRVPTKERVLQSFSTTI